MQPFQGIGVDDNLNVDVCLFIIKKKSRFAMVSLFL